MMGYDHPGWSAGDWLVMSMMMLIFLGVLTALAVWLARSVGGSNRPPQSELSSTVRADEVLAERYARGEIDEDEFRRRHGLLHGSPR